MSHNRIVRVHTSFRNTTPFSGGMPTFRARTLLLGYCPVIQLLCCCFDPIQCVSSFQPVCTSVLELPCLPHALFNLVDLFLVDKEEAGCLVEMRNLGGEREVVNVFQRVVELRLFVSAVLEAPEVVMCVPWSSPLIMIRDCIQGPTVLAPVSGNNADNMWVWTHNDPSIPRWDTPSFTVSNDAGDEIGPSVEIEP